MPLDFSTVKGRNVQWFVSQHERRRLRYGVLVALAGVSGRGKRARAAHHELIYWAERGIGLVLLTREELEEVKSGGHLAAVIELKRQVLVSSYRARVLNEEEIRELDPGRRRSRGFQGIEEALREIRARAVDEVLNAATQRGECGLTEGLADARRRLDLLAEQVIDRQENPDEDPFWRREYECVVSVGAAFVRLLDRIPAGEEPRRIFHFEVDYAAPRGMRALPGAELWSLLSEYYFRQASTEAEMHRRGSVYSMVALVIEQMLLIDDIEPYGFFEEEQGDYE